MGALYVAMSIIMTPQLGASTTIGFIIGGQMIASIVLDHFGLLNLPTSPATLPKLGGAALVIIGAIINLKLPGGIARRTLPPAVCPQPFPSGPE